MQASGSNQTLEYPTEPVSSLENWQIRAGKLLENLERKDLETGNHVWRVAFYSVRLAKAVKLAEAAFPALYFGSLLHDVGKLIIPDFVLKKPTKLNADEWSVMRNHPEHGRRLLQNISVPEDVWVVAAQHHERWDGGGYPCGLKETEIHLHARIFAVADAFDALTSNRCYRAKTAYDIACSEISAYAGTQFDPVIVETFLNIDKEEWERALSQ